MAQYSRNTFVGTRIALDGNDFQGNVFNQCILVYGGGPLNFVNNTVSNSSWQFVDAAARTISLLSSFYQSEAGKEFVHQLLENFNKQPILTPSQT
jgi:hypothetical protein